ncbi:hypothetical protein D3C85_1546390 [compost metagenome]
MTKTANLFIFSKQNKSDYIRKLGKKQDIHENQEFQLAVLFLHWYQIRTNTILVIKGKDRIVLVILKVINEPSSERVMLQSQKNSLRS